MSSKWKEATEGEIKFEEILTIDEAAKALKVGHQKIRKEIKLENLKAYKLGKLWRIKRKDLDEYVEKNLVTA